MSLINDALKKAQRERDDAGRLPPPHVPGLPPPPQGKGPGRPFWPILVGAALVAAGSTWLTLRLTRPDSAGPVASASQTPSPAPTPSPVPPPPASPLPTPSPTPLPLLTLSPEAERARIQAVVDRLTIAAIRISENGNRALVNDRLLRTGDALEGLPGVRVKEIANDRIDFIDTEGRLYTKRR